MSRRARHPAVLAAPARAWNDQAIAAKKGDGGPDLLSAVVVDAFILRDVDVQPLEIGPQEPQPALRRDAEAVKGSRPTGSRRELAPMKCNLGQSPFTHKARVKHRNQPFRCPAAATGRRGERVEAPPRRPESFSIKTLGSEGAEPLQQCRIMDHKARALRRRRCLEAERSCCGPLRSALSGSARPASARPEASAARTTRAAPPADRRSRTARR
jgi:hypothetical protein